ncbi:MAG: sigma-70 family RNA polymerase sigma factor [Xanthomonadales bacterium]|nr:sigma-70 family RNA polymerase sigma factor [Xanthomonadales bacterium]
MSALPLCYVDATEKAGWSKTVEEFDYGNDATDAVLVQGLVRRSSQALELLYDRHSGRMLAAAVRLLGNRRDAEDLVHDVFLECWQRADQFDEGRGSVVTWMLTRLHSRGIDRLRSLQVARKHALAAPPPIGHPSPAAAPAAGASPFRQALAGLSEVQRTVLELCYYRGMTCSEIARFCDLPLGTVKSRLAAGLSALRQRMERPDD